jgi:hypothetical protein
VEPFCVLVSSILSGYPFSIEVDLAQLEGRTPAIAPSIQIMMKTTPTSCVC